MKIELICCYCQRRIYSWDDYHYNYGTFHEACWRYLKQTDILVRYLKIVSSNLKMLCEKIKADIKNPRLETQLDTKEDLLCNLQHASKDIELIECEVERFKNTSN
jgi:hypothetical protein